MLQYICGSLSPPVCAWMLGATINADSGFLPPCPGNGLKQCCSLRPARGAVTFTATLTSSLACFTILLSIQSTQRDDNTTISLCFHSAKAIRIELSGCLGKMSSSFLLSTRFYQECSLSSYLKEQSGRVLNLHMAAIHCTLGEISLLHAHLEWAHLLIRSDPGVWLALLFSIRAVEIMPSK